MEREADSVIGALGAIVVQIGNLLFRRLVVGKARRLHRLYAKRAEIALGATLLLI
jgi:hypothetical protein